MDAAQRSSARQSAAAHGCRGRSRSACSQRRAQPAGGTAPHTHAHWLRLVQAKLPCRAGFARSFTHPRPDPLRPTTHVTHHLERSLMPASYIVATKSPRPPPSRSISKMSEMAVVRMLSTCMPHAAALQRAPRPVQAGRALRSRRACMCAHRAFGNSRQLRAFDDGCLRPHAPPPAADLQRQGLVSPPDAMRAHPGLERVQAVRGARPPLRCHGCSRLQQADSPVLETK